MIAPIIPGLNDREIPTLLDAVAQAGAQWAGYVLLRLPWQIKELFSHWLTTHFPERAEHVLSLIRDTRGGELYDPRFGVRMKGQGPFAQQIAQLFQVHAARRGLLRSRWLLRGDHFRRPQDPPSPQLSLFGPS
jgi:DNA repair photolyase